ncbi:MAG: CAP domain-containing protein, partial [Actinomycetota bacterium]
DGYWLAGRDGGVFSFGDARFYGSMGNRDLNQPIVTMAATPTGRGYWLVASDGGVFAFGDAGFYGSTGNIRLNQHIADMAATPTGGGYWMVAADGGMFTFGDASFFGSTGNRPIPQPIVAMAPTPAGRGYWLLGGGGDVYPFGSARHHGSPTGYTMTELLPSSSGGGYLLVTTGGGVLGFGDARYYGSLGVAPLRAPVVAASDVGDDGYRMTAADGTVLVFEPYPRTIPTGMSTTPGKPASPETAMAREIFDRVNAERRARGITPLLWDPELAATASGWSREMAGDGFRHSDLRLAMQQYENRYNRLGENIYAGSGSYADAGSAHTSWMVSSSHRLNIVQPGFTSIGIGVFCDGAGRAWVTEQFGTHRDHGYPAQADSAPAAPLFSPQDTGAAC